MRKFAARTSVSVEKTETEIKSYLRKHGANAVGTYSSSCEAVVVFDINNRRVKFVITLTGTDANDNDRRKSDAEDRRRWRCLLLVIKAKFEAIESQIEDFDESFLSHIVSRDGKTVWEEDSVMRLLASLDEGTLPTLGEGSAN